MRPKLLETFNGYATDLDGVTFFLICREQNEQLEIPLRNVPRAVRERLADGSSVSALVYENGVSVRLRSKRVSKEAWKARVKAARRWARRWVKKFPSL